MEILPSVDIESRKRWIKALFLLSKKRGIKNPFFFARSIENIAHCKRQQKNEIISGVDVMRYGSIEVLDISDTKVHLYHATVCYTNLLRRYCFIIFNGFHTKILGGDPMDLINASDEQISEGSAHCEWEKKFFEKQELARKILLDKKSSVSRGIFACPKCKSFDVDTEQKQTRSADEPMTNFCTCNNCGKKFVH